MKNQINYTKPAGKKFTQPSQTIPDQTMSVKTILERYASGLPLQGLKEPIFEQEDTPSSGINPKTLDLVDWQRLQIENKEQIENLQANAKKEAEEKNIERLKKIEEEENKAFIKSIIKH